MQKESSGITDIKHWADQTAEEILENFPDEKTYTCAAGISPSGTVHFGNFREVMTVELVVRALKSLGKNVRFIYSWDDYDRFRKTPGNIPVNLNEYIGMPYCDIPDPFECNNIHKNYGEHFEKEFEESLIGVDVTPEFIRQHEKYRACIYADSIKHALVNREKIKAILEKYKTEPIDNNWFPLQVYCEKCKKDSTIISHYDENYTIGYECKCGHKNTIDFRKAGIVKLPWRADWPMRWNFENVSFEPGGKEHSTPGGSRTTGEEIIQEVWNRKPPVYKKYDFIILKGGGKMSGSKGNVVSLREVLEYYEPEMVRWLFAGTRPNAEFFISFDLGIIQAYEDFDKCERIYYDKTLAKDEKEYVKEKRIYELSSIRIQDSLPIQPGFRHLTNLLQIYENDFERLKEYYKHEIKTGFDIERLRRRAYAVWKWLETYAPEDFRFKIQAEINTSLDDKEKNALRLLAGKLRLNKYDENTLFEEFYRICTETGIANKKFFSAAYRVLIGKEKGPKLASFIVQIGKERVLGLLDRV